MVLCSKQMKSEIATTTPFLLECAHKCQGFQTSDLESLQNFSQVSLVVKK